MKVARDVDNNNENVTVQVCVWSVRIIVVTFVHLLQIHFLSFNGLIFRESPSQSWWRQKGPSARQNWTCRQVRCAYPQRERVSRKDFLKKTRQKPARPWGRTVWGEHKTAEPCSLLPKNCNEIYQINTKH